MTLKLSGLLKKIGSACFFIAVASLFAAALLNGWDNGEKLSADSMELIGLEAPKFENSTPQIIFFLKTSGYFAGYGVIFQLLGLCLRRAYDKKALRRVWSPDPMRKWQ